MIKELILKEAISSISKILVGLATKEGKHAGLSVSEKDLDDALAHHTKYVANWSSQITIKDIPRSRQLEDIFVVPSYFERAHSSELIDFAHLFTSDHHTVILGGPGAGKTTAIKMICQHHLREKEAPSDRHAFPLLVRLRDVSLNESLFDYILSIFGIRIEFPDLTKEEDSGKIYKENIKERVVTDYIDRLQPLLLLDGLDEVPAEYAHKVVREISRLTNLLSSTRIVLTCRAGALDASFDNSETIYTSPFSHEQIIEFCQKWFLEPSATGRFLSTVKKTPYYDTIGRPLTLANLCVIYDAYGELPETPSIVYQKIILLLLEEWDRQRDIKRLSRYGQFGPERKKMFLASLAFELCSEGYRSVFEEGDLLRIYRKISSKFGLPIEERQEVLREIESHSGLVIQSGLNVYEFSHKTMQEYLCADHISRMPNLETSLPKLALMPQECAIATILSADPNEFFQFLVKSMLANGTETDHQEYSFWSQYISRLLIEKVQFESTMTLGATYLIIASKLWKEKNSGSTNYLMDSNGKALFEVLEEFLENDSIRNSLCLASKGLARVGSGKELLKIIVMQIKRTQFEAWIPDILVVSRNHIPPNNALLVSS